MARKSTAALAVVRPSIGDPPPPPADLSEDEAALWREIAESKPADWFGPDSMPVFKEYVRASVTCDLLAGRVQKALADDGERDLRLYMDLRDKEARRAVSLATKLRLTQQSRYGARSADRADARASGPRPWQS